MATSTIPIVFAYGGDPVSDGLVASFNRPGGNVTGSTFIGTALTSKKMGLLREILPKVSDIALLVNPKGTLAGGQINEAKAAAKVLGLNLSIVTAISEQRVRPRLSRRWKPVEGSGSVSYQYRSLIRL